ncbi:MAG: hypothetical protein R2824_02520 [Saprospiraceae bacterium]
MELVTFKQHIRQLISRNATDRTLSILEQVIQGSRQENELTIIASRYLQLKKENRLGVKGADAITLERNQIHQSLLDLLNELGSTQEGDILQNRLNNVDETDFVVTDQEKEWMLKPSAEKASPFPTGIIYLSIAGVIIILVILFGKSNLNFIFGENNQINNAHDTRPEEFRNAYEQISRELNENFTSLGVLIRGFNSRRPEQFSNISPKADNEYPPAYTKRTQDYYKEELTYIWSLQEEFAPSSQAFDAHRGALRYDGSSLNNLERCYAKQKEIQKNIQQFVQRMRTWITPQTGESSIYQNMSQQHEATLIAVKIAFVESLNYFLLSMQELPEVYFFDDHLREIGINIEADNLKDWQIKTTLEIANLYKEKTKIIGAQLPVQNDGSVRSISPKITDPYLIQIRRMAGLPDTLTQADQWSLSHKMPLEDLTNIKQLMSQAYLSFIESDGELAAYYLEKTLMTKQDSLGEIQKNYLQWSLKRLNDPHIFGGAIGIMVFDINEKQAPQNIFQRGDIISKIGNEIINDPGKIDPLTSAVKSSKHQFQIFRNGTPRIVEVPINGAVGLKLTPLVMYEPAWH